MSKFSQEIEVGGHLIDSSILTKIFDKIMDLKGEFQVEEIEIGKSICLNPGTEIAVLTIGTIGNTAKEVIQGFSIVDQKKIAHHNMRFVKPLDTSLLHRIFKDYNTIITIEEGILAGGFGSAILEFAQENNYQNHTIKRLGIPDTFIEHGKVPELHKKTELDTAHIKSVITNFL